jgi:hypothetical protein
MSVNRLKGGVLVLLLGIILAAIAWWLLPRVVAALPGRVRYYVPDKVIAIVTTPLPTALPTPAALSNAGLALATPIPSVTPSPTQATAGNLPEELPTLAASSATSTPTTEPVPTLFPYVRLTGIPIIPQKFNNCGPTNLTLVLNYYNIAVDQFDVAAVVRPNYEDRNVSPDELAAYVRGETEMEAGVFSGGDISLLKRLVAAGYPVIIETGLLPDETTGWMGHYLSVIGFDDITRHFSVRDTYLGPWHGDGFAGYDDLGRAWSAFNYTFIAVYPVEKSEELHRILGDDFEIPDHMWIRAAERARQAISANRDDPFAWFNLGTSLTEMAARAEVAGGYEPAVAAFDQARRLGLPPRMLWYQFAPYRAYLATGRYTDVIELTDLILDDQGGRNVEETYFYRGFALRELGDEAAAREAFARVMRLNPASKFAELAQAALNSEG